MALTAQYVVDRAREVLNDADGDRYTDVQLFAYIDEATRIARRVRPDLFIYAYTPAPVAPGDPPAPSENITALTDTLRVPDSYADAVAHYVCGRAELRDDEFAVDGRAMTLLGKLESTLVRGF